MTATAMKGRVNVFSRVRPGVAREVGDQHCVEMNTDMHKCVVRLQDGDAVERFLDLKKDAAAKVAALAEVSAEEITRRVEALQRVTH